MINSDIILVNFGDYSTAGQNNIQNDCLVSKINLNLAIEDQEFLETKMTFKIM